MSAARRVAPAPLHDVPPGVPDYASAFEVTTDAARGPAGSALEAARQVFEQAPTLLRLFVRFGWRWVLWLRLGPSGAPGYVAGWRVVEDSLPAVALQVDSPLIEARKVVRVDGDRLTAATYVWFQNRVGRVVWTSLSVVHHRVEPLLLGLGARRG